jgi:hypothetical protein
MRVFSLYYKDTFVASFPTREDAIKYGKEYYPEYAWDCNIIEEYRYKSKQYNDSLDTLREIYEKEKKNQKDTITPYQPYIPVNPYSPYNPTTPYHPPNIWCGTQDNMGKVTATYRNELL